MRIRPLIGTLCGLGVGVLALTIWMLTFQPHGGAELSGYLFPLSALILEHMYSARSIPVLLWYGGSSSVRLSIYCGEFFGESHVMRMRAKHALQRARGGLHDFQINNERRALITNFK